jgi:iron(III) transport system ATP-binding protein
MPAILAANCAPTLQVQDLRVTLATEGKPNAVIRGLDFALATGEIGCLLGPSGCGKTTALRAIAGFVRPDSGVVRINGTVVSDGKIWLDANQRGVGIVFQDYALECTSERWFWLAALARRKAPTAN